MSIIVDANCLSITFSPSSSEDFKPIIVALINGRHRLTIGGTKLKNEYKKLTSISGMLKNLDQAGRIVQIVDSEVNDEESVLLRDFDLKSDDPHILALARISGARILCSHDKDLGVDFQNLTIIPKPRGQIYKRSDHSHLLR
jgi:predicted nucleic acid-binding protein